MTNFRNSLRHFLLRTISIAFILVSLIALQPLQAAQPQAPADSLNYKIGQMLMVGFRGFSVEAGDSIVRDIQKLHLGGVILFDYDVPRKEARRNIRSPEQLRRLTRQLQSFSNTPLFIAVDQEGGTVNRLKTRYGFPSSVSAAYLGKIDDADTTRYYAQRTANLLDTLGFNVNFAPVVDLNTNPDNPVIGKLDRSFGADPQRVTRHARIMINQMLDHGILPVLKHFPGHGSAHNDSHHGVVDVTESWSPTELEPYRRLFQTTQVPMVMTAHIFNARIDSSWPATLSPKSINGLLRDSLGFDGVVVSDDLQMGAIRDYYGLETTIYRALDAGVDILLFANNSVFDPEIAQKSHRIIRKLIKEGRIAPARIDRSYRRIQQMKARWLE